VIIINISANIFMCRGFYKYFFVFRSFIRTFVGESEATVR